MSFMHYYLFLKVIELVINKKRKEKLEGLLEDIGVPFKFFEVQQEDGQSQTQWTRLDGNTLFFKLYHKQNYNISETLNIKLTHN